MKLSGLIAGALGGAAKGYTQVAETNFKKSAELDLKKQLMEAETDKQLAIDAIKRQRDIVDEDRKMTPEYLAKAGAADLTKGTIAAENRTTLAPLTAGAETAEYTAKKPLEDTKAADATGRKITETTTLASNKDFIKGETLLAEAKGAAGTKQAKIRADSIKDRAPGSGGRPKAETTADLNRIVTQSTKDAARILGVNPNEFNSAYARLQKRTDPASVALLEKVKPYVDDLDAASTRLKNWKAGVPQPSSSGRDLSKLSAYERDEKAD
jgi:hypothetical protein